MDKPMFQAAVAPGYTKVGPLIHQLLTDGLGADSTAINFG